MSEVSYRELRQAPAMPMNFARALLRARVRPGHHPRLPDTGLRLNDVSQDSDHLAAYRKVCHFSADGHLPITYPHMHAFPLHMALITASDFPFPAMGLVHVRNSITPIPKPPCTRVPGRYRGGRSTPDECRADHGMPECHSR